MGWVGVKRGSGELYGGKQSALISWIMYIYYSLLTIKVEIASAIVLLIISLKKWKFADKWYVNCSEIVDDWLNKHKEEKNHQIFNQIKFHFMFFNIFPWNFLPQIFQIIFCTSPRDFLLCGCCCCCYCYNKPFYHNLLLFLEIIEKV